MPGHRTPVADYCAAAVVDPGMPQASARPMPAGTRHSAVMCRRLSPVA
jgi:hypothetical protein